MNNSPDLSKWYFNDVLGLGDPAWCTKIRELREYERIERKIVPVKYWTIAKEITERQEEEKKAKQARKQHSLGKTPMTNRPRWN